MSSSQTFLVKHAGRLAIAAGLLATVFAAIAASNSGRRPKFLRIWDDPETEDHLGI